MTLLVEDTARNNLAAWTAEALQAGHVQGAILSPFTTPSTAKWKQGGAQTAERVQDAGGETLFDPTTHGLQMPNVGDFKYYDTWDLWSGARGALGSTGDQRDHVQRVFAVQQELEVQRLAPTILLHSAQSAESQQALDLSTVAVEEDNECWLAIAGDASFWAAGSALDAHVGALAQLEPAGWVVCVARNLTVLPVQATAEEVHGLCRTVRSLSEDGPVHVSHGDLATLPAVVAGARTIGTGWDPRQRVCAYESFVLREGGDGGQWFVQSTLGGLLSLLGRAEAELLAAGDPALANRLLPGPVPPQAPEVWAHHAEVLSELVARLQPGGEASYHDLRDLYAAARTDWDLVAAELGVKSRADAWLQQFARGLELYASTEGW